MNELSDEQIREIEKEINRIKGLKFLGIDTIFKVRGAQDILDIIAALRASNKAVEKLAARHATASQCPPPKFVCQFYIDAGLEDCLKCWKKWAHDETT